jgi:asparagine synthetase B (glutamine-hydrolysing)
MIELDRPETAVRRLLRVFRSRPHLLLDDPVATRIRAAFESENCRQAVLVLIERTFSSGRDSGRLREILTRCDIEGQKARTAAAAMNLSLRQFYRSRAEAIKALALAIEQLETSQPHSLGAQTPTYCAMCQRRLDAYLTSLAGTELDAG